MKVSLFSCGRIVHATRMALAVLGIVTATTLSVSPAKGAAALWISAPAWSYSAALAQSPFGTAYFWGLSIGVGSYSWAGAYSLGGGGAAYAFAEAGAGQGGMGAFLATGIADPWGGDAIDIPLIDPSNPSSYPSSAPVSDPFSSSYTVSGTGITFTSGTGTEMSGDDEIEAFVYNGGTSESALDSELGVSNSTGDTNSVGDVTSLSSLESDFSLVPLDSAIDDPSSLSSLTFTENTSDLNSNDSNVILVGIEDEPVPEPGPTWLLGIGLAGLLIFRKLRASPVA